jgi:hypothetical protein
MEADGVRVVVNVLGQIFSGKYECIFIWNFVIFMYLYVCMYIYVSTCTYIYTYTYERGLLWIFQDRFIQVLVYVYICAYMYVLYVYRCRLERIFSGKYVCTFLRKFMIFKYLYVCMYVYMYIDIHMYTCT